MKVLREQLEMSQTDLAVAMKRRDFAFHQQTVQRIESGDRPVRLSEAYAIAEILKSTVPAMAMGIENARLFFSAREVMDESLRLRDAARAYELTRLRLATEIDKVRESAAAADGVAELDAWLDRSADKVAHDVMREMSSESAEEGGEALERLRSSRTGSTDG